MNRKTHYSRVLVRVVVALGLCLASTSLLADCRQYGEPYPRTVSATLRNISVDGSEVVEAELDSYLAEAGGYPIRFDCDPVQTFTYRFSSALPVVSSGATGAIYESGVPGVGYKLQYGSDGAFAPQTWNVQSGKVIPSAYYIRLKKTGPISPGVLQGRELGTVSVDGIGTIIRILVKGSGTVTVVERACDAIGAKEVNLGKLSAKSLDSSTSAGEQLVNIPLKCPANIKVFAKLSGVAPPESSGVGLVRNSGTAEGVAVQFLDWDRKPIKLGETREQPNFNPMAYYTYVSAYKIGRVSAGTINAQATLTLTYQ